MATGVDDGTPIEIWFQDGETHAFHRVGQKNTLTRRWARRGTRPRAPHDQRTKWAHGAYASVKIVHSGEVGEPIVFEAYPGDMPIIVGGFKIRYAAYITIRGFKVTGKGIRITGPGVKGMVIDKNHLVDVVGSGILVRGVRPSQGQTPAGYDFQGAIDIVVSNNILERVLNSGYQEIITLSYGVLNCEVFGNTIFDGGNSATGGQGIDLKQGVENCRVHDNEIFNGRKIGIYLDAGNNFIRDVEIYNNYIHDNAGTGITVGTEGTGGNERVHVHHNRIEDPAGAPLQEAIGKAAGGRCGVAA